MNGYTPFRDFRDDRTARGIPREWVEQWERHREIHPDMRPLLMNPPEEVREGEEVGSEDVVRVGQVVAADDVVPERPQRTGGEIESAYSADHELRQIHLEHFRLTLNRELAILDDDDLADPGAVIYAAVYANTTGQPGRIYGSVGDRLTDRLEFMLSPEARKRLLKEIEGRVRQMGTEEVVDDQTLKVVTLVVIARMDLGEIQEAADLVDSLAPLISDHIVRTQSPIASSLYIISTLLALHLDLHRPLLPKPSPNALTGDRPFVSFATRLLETTADWALIDTAEAKSNGHLPLLIALEWGL